MATIRHKHEAIEALKELEAKSDVRFFIVGGYVRDALRNKPSKDIDVVAINTDLKHLNKLLQTKGETKFIPFSSTKFGIVLFRMNGGQHIEIALPRVEYSTGSGHRDFEVTKGVGVTLEQDSARRDFKINSMYLPIGYKSRKEIVDYHGGAKDIRDRRISFIGKATDRIKEDPLRMLRLVSLQAKTGYRINSDAIETVKKSSDLLWKIPADRIKDELETILLSKKPSKSIRLLADLKLLKIIIQELDDCRGVQQEKTFHKYDIFIHCIRACDFTPPVLSLRYAALLHDIGKLDVKKWDENKERFTFHNHHQISIHKAEEILKRLRLSKEFIKEVCFLIEMHMYDYRAGWKDKTVRKFIKKIGITKSDLCNLSQIPLFQLRIADRLGSGFKNIPITYRQKAFENRIKSAFKKAEIFDIKDLVVNGGDISKYLKIAPGPKVGIILEELLDITMESPLLNNRKDLLELSSDLLKRIDDVKIAFVGHWNDWKKEVLKAIRGE